MVLRHPKLLGDQALKSCLIFLTSAERSALEPYQLVATLDLSRGGVQLDIESESWIARRLCNMFQRLCNMFQRRSEDATFAATFSGGWCARSFTTGSRRYPFLSVRSMIAIESVLLL
jgi:hypothetical protein